MKVALFVLLAATFVLLAPRDPLPGDARLHAATAQALARRGDLDVTFVGPLEHTVVDAGRRMATVDLLPSVALLPAETVALMTRAPLWGRGLLASATAALLAALAGVLFFSRLRRLGCGPAVALAATLALAVALLPQARVPDGGALGAVLLLAALEALDRASARAAAGLGAALLGLVLVDAQAAPAALVLAGVAAARRRDRAAVAAVVGLPLVAGLALAVAHHVYTGWAPSRPPDLVEGLYGLVLSTGKSVFLYAPPLLLLAWAWPWWWRTRRREATVGTAVALTWLVGVALDPRWHGDPAWGPRRLAPLLPLLAEPIALWADGPLRAASARLRALAVSLVGAAIVVQLLGAALSPEAYLTVLRAVRNKTGAPGWFESPPSASHFIPQLSPIVGQAWLVTALATGDAKRARETAPFKLLVPEPPVLEAELRALRVDWWLLGAPPVPSALVAGALVGLVAFGALGTRPRRRVVT